MSYVPSPVPQDINQIPTYLNFELQHIANNTASSTVANTGVISQDGIKFPATQVASADVNTLDDYEEGTWAPVFAWTNPGTSSFTYAAQQGAYTKIGNTVRASCFLQVSASTLGTGTGYLTVQGLPFTAGTQMSFVAGSVGYAYGFTTNAPTSCLLQQNTKTIWLYYTSGGESVILDATKNNNSMALYLSVCYWV
ncbi:MAG: hypothetical protein ACXWT5_06035 [Methylophilus sp.]